MENTPATGNSKWSLAAKDGLILAAVTVVISTLTFLTKNTILSSLLWLIKLGGSIWLLSVIMKRYGKAHPEESTFSYGLIVCVLSALVCAVWAFVEYQFLFPNAVAVQTGGENVEMAGRLIFHGLVGAGDFVRHDGILPFTCSSGNAQNLF